MPTEEIIDSLKIITTTNPVEVTTADKNTLVLVKTDGTFNGPNNSIKVACGDKVSPSELATAIANKVDVVAGKGLSTNDFTTAEKTKLGIPAFLHVRSTAQCGEDYANEIDIMLCNRGEINLHIPVNASSTCINDQSKCIAFLCAEKGLPILNAIDCSLVFRKGLANFTEYGTKYNIISMVYVAQNNTWIVTDIIAVDL